MNDPTRNPTKVYLLVFGTLLVLTGLTTAVAFADLGKANLPIAMTIAASKAALVILFFMHVRWEGPLIWATVAAAAIWLAVLFGLTLWEVGTRPEWPVNTATAHGDLGGEHRESRFLRRI